MSKNKGRERAQMERGPQSSVLKIGWAGNVTRTVLEEEYEGKAERARKTGVGESGSFKPSR